ncbi:MAG TPA: homoserine dehydrogenase [Rhodanobacteraceae bacterium]|jgi:aspartokinase/homoserine dehydrogenase 1|nr:homoserine dehydrogenase [Rhodanobacteraceae bacterium]
MSALPNFSDVCDRPVAVDVRDEIAAVLLGTGVVGSALLHLLANPAGARVRLVGVANSRRQHAEACGIDLHAAPSLLASAEPGRNDAALLEVLDRSEAARRVVIDATASSETAARHADWLAAGYDVVTANKAAAAAPTRAWNTLRAACSREVSYGDAAIVGAGLPALATLRRMRACGDALISLEGVFSGSLSWLFNQYDGHRPFSALLREAHAFGYTEPDPRADLCGTDVVRKLVILARGAGHTLDIGDVENENLVPAHLGDVDVPTFLERAGELDEAIEHRRAIAAAQGCVLRHLAALDENGNARAGLVAVSPDHPAARLAGTDNLFVLTTLRYRARPLVIQGPGAGAEVTAQALLGDLLSLRAARHTA